MKVVCYFEVHTSHHFPFLRFCMFCFLVRELNIIIAKKNKSLDYWPHGIFIHYGYFGRPVSSTSECTTANVHHS